MAPLGAIVLFNNNMTDIIVEPFSISRYRSFGQKIQRFEKFSKINLFIGQNNCGKSNILKFIHDIYSNYSSQPNINLEPLDQHLPVRSGFCIGQSISVARDADGNYTNFNEKITSKFRENLRLSSVPGMVLRVFLSIAEYNNINEVWFEYDNNNSLLFFDHWEKAFSTLNDRDLSQVWTGLTGRTGGSRKQHWLPEILNSLKPSFNTFNTVLIPAIRKIGEKSSLSEDFSGNGIIERLVRLQNPDVHNQRDREKFNKINDFLRNVTDNSSATIEIPHERDTILVHMDGKTLPLDSLGTGIHEVIILASAATILDNTAICMEEPELHLNPILQKKLVLYLLNSTENQYFITTHSAALMDTPTAETYHISLEEGQSMVTRVTSDSVRSVVCEDLGYRPSDLMQSNCIIWVEGPADRIYLNYWIKSITPNLIEGIHYSIMFYGGKLAAHISGNDVDDLLEDFISLRRLNRRSIILIDSDKSKPREKINKTKERLKNEFDKGPGYAWITQGREIENYIPADHLKEAIKETIPSSRLNSDFGQYDNSLSIITKSGAESQASKVKIAKYIVEKFPANLKILDLNKNLTSLIEFIQKSNPGINKT